ncbi:S8 family serine peptidase [Polyangium jinanense]|uniref:S8 family serine peptidase n=1 Tax=Polyangium jinanense TaxID=2829994 RepID=A0A9X3X9Q6_9BACT|nr:S8 family serine peptidase [Polyangium jinanense]MDC3955936.1 S8 family serine peptidase [Polyangium jinanense]MDC3985125.1 S8 family serine peptidase [Polyangium jinanense]
MTETNPEAAEEPRRVRVALVDSGVDTSHPWLVNAELRSLRVERKGEGYAVCPDDPVDRSGHGTACAGIIHRLAPFAEITSVCVLSPEGRCSRDGLLAAVRFCVREGFDVVNLSLGIDVPKGAPLRPTDYKSIVELYEIADIAYTAGVVLVASGPNASAFRTYPGRFKSLIGVGRASSDDPEFLRTEITVDWEILAPGNDVLAPALGGGERRWTGTSFAAPHVAAHVARLRRDRSDLSIQDIKAALHALAARRLEREAGLPRVSMPPAQIDHGGALSS